MQLPPMKRPHQVKMVKYTNYCHYHRLVGHPLQKWHTFKEWVSQWLRKRNIALAKHVLKQHRTIQTMNCNVIVLGSDSKEELCFPLDDKEDEEMVVRKLVVDSDSLSKWHK